MLDNIWPFYDTFLVNESGEKYGNWMELFVFLLKKIFVTI